MVPTRRDRVCFFLRALLESEKCLISKTFYPLSSTFRFQALFAFSTITFETSELLATTCLSILSYDCLQLKKYFEKKIKIHYIIRFFSQHLNDVRQSFLRFFTPDQEILTLHFVFKQLEVVSEP